MIIEKITKRAKYANVIDKYDLFIPDQFAPVEEKETPDWIKSTLDYYANIAYSQYWNNQTLKKNYDLLNGILVKEDYFTEDYQEVVDFLDETSSVELPDYVKHYPMMNPPLNTLIGEITKRPDNVKVKAVDEHTYNEVMRMKAELMNDIYSKKINEVIQRLATKMGLQQKLEQLQTTQPASEEEAQQIQQQIQQVQAQFEELRPEEFENYFNKRYQPVAEQWGNLKLDQMKLQFNIKDKSQEAYRDLTTVAREYHHIYVDRSKFGFSYEVLNPVKTWFLTEPDPKFTTECYAIGYIDSMELSKIIDRFTLTEEEIIHLKEHKDDVLRNPNSDVNIFEDKSTGFDSVNYATHNPLKTQYEATIRAEMEQQQLLDSYDPAGNRYNPIGYLGYESRNHRYTVVQAYFKSKRKIGRLTYVDEQGLEQIDIIDEYFVPDPKNTTIEIEWEYVNQWYSGYRIGQSIYGMEPLYYSELPPIIGAFYRAKNTIPKSLVDQMKVYQIIYNICLNQLYLLLEKEVGIAMLYNLRQLPRYKDMEDEDALEKMTMLAKESGVVGVDDSPENTKGPSTFNQYTRLDLTRTQEIQSRMSLAAWCKEECWSLLGFTPQRLGGVAATETATGINTSLAQSFSQTEPITNLHEECMNLVYQQLLDTALYVEAKKPVSTIKYVNSDMHDVFVQVNTEDIKLRDLQVFVSNRSEDKRKLEEIRQLSLAYAQNQLHPYYTTMIHNSQSVSEIRDMLHGDMKKKEQQAQQQQQIEQQKLQQAQQIEEQRRQLELEKEQRKMQFDAQQKELDRKKDLLIAQIGANKFAKDQDINKDNIPDSYQIAQFDADYQKMFADVTNQQLKLQNEKEKYNNDYDIKKEELRLKESEIASKERIEKIKSDTVLKNKVQGEK